jgi:tetratricopeptide (TPR) repeat protein
MHSPSFANLGLARFTAGYLDGAVAAYERAVELDPDAFMSAVMLAEAYDERGRQERAMALRETLLRRLEAMSAEQRGAMREDESALRRSLSIAYTSAGRIESASQVLLDGLDVDPRLVIPFTLCHIAHIPASEAAIADTRALTMELIDTVLVQLRSGELKLVTGQSVELYSDAGYYLTYHGLNNELFRRKIGDMHAMAYPHLTLVLPHVDRGEGPDGAALSGHAALLASAAVLRTPPVLDRRWVVTLWLPRPCACVCVCVCVYVCACVAPFHVRTSS